MSDMAKLEVDPEVARRAELFRRQIEAAPTRALPLLILPGVVAEVGTCLSCGGELPAHRAHRCELCLVAINLALGA